jgi:hypothetical protein
MTHPVTPVSQTPPSEFNFPAGKDHVVIFTAVWMP